MKKANLYNIFLTNNGHTERLAVVTETQCEDACDRYYDAMRTLNLYGLIFAEAVK